jgi:hypothetical protein
MATRSPRPDAQLLERVGAPPDIGEQLGIGDRPAVARLAFPVVGDLLASTGLDVAVEAVGGDVEPAADEPAGERRLPLQHRLPRRRPVEALGLGSPEGLRVRRRPLVNGGVVDDRVRGEVGRRREVAMLREQRLDGDLVGGRARLRVAHRGPRVSCRGAVAGAQTGPRAGSDSPGSIPTRRPGRSNGAPDGGAAAGRAH